MTSSVHQRLDFHQIVTEIIAQRKRLGWTTEQSRDYLIKTYNKRSTQVLSDEQLIEFLEFLKGIPSPTPLELSFKSFSFHRTIEPSDPIPF